MILKLSCPDRVGLVARITGFLAEHGANILEMSQFTDSLARWFFLRISFDAAALDLDEDSLRQRFGTLAQALDASWHLRSRGRPMPAAILVTQAPHCLHDLLARASSGELPLDIRAILSNRENLRETAERAGIPFLHLPVASGRKTESFQNYGEALAETGAELVILARFMQILPPGLCAHYAGRLINIHHSFLPAFVGANPYRQAFERGVKIIGATSHYVTADLDAGPIIEQEVMRVEHHHTPDDLRRLGRDCECLALSRAVRYHASDRVLIHGNKTIVFRD